MEYRPSVKYLIVIGAVALTALAPQAHAATGVELADGFARVEADPATPPGEIKESNSLPFDQTATAGGATARQQTTVTDTGGGLIIESTNELTASDADFAYTQLERRFTVTKPGLRLKITGVLADSQSGGNSNEQIITFERVDGPGGSLVFKDSDNPPEFSEEGQLEPGTYELALGGSCTPGAGTTCSATLQVKLELGEACAPEVRVALVVAEGCFLEREPGVFTTDQKAWVGGFEIVPRSGGELVVNPGAGTISERGAGTDVMFAEFAVPIPISLLPIRTAEGTFELNVPGTIEKILLNLPVEGTVKVSWADGGRSSALDSEVKLSSLIPDGDLVTIQQQVGVGEVAGKLKARLVNRTGFVVDQAEVKIDELNFIPRRLRVPRLVSLRNILLRFERRLGRPFWTGQAGIRLPLARGALDVTGRAFVFDGDLAGVGLSVNGINQRIVGPFLLQRVSGDVLFAPTFGLELGVGGSLGPRINGKELLSIDGTMQVGSTVRECENGQDPMKISGAAKFKPLEPLELAGIAEAEVTTKQCTYVSTPAYEGSITSKLSFFSDAMSAEGTHTGFISTTGASLEGSNLLRLPLLPDLSGSGIISTVGFAACANLTFFQGGFGYRWGAAGGPSMFQGCDLAPFRVTASSAGTRRARAASTLRVPAGLPHVAFSAASSAGPPPLTVSGPGGVRLRSPADGSALRSRRALILPVAHEKKTYVVVNDPRAGAWKIESTDSGRPLSRVALAPGLAKPKVRARVRRRGKKLRLTYTVAPIPGQRVVFSERGEGVAKRLGVARGRRGSIAIKPTLATTGTRRTIEAEVVQNGLPRALLTVARFTAPRPAKPKKARVKAKRARTSLTLSWPRLAGTTNHLVEVRSGTTVLQRLFTKRRRLTFTGMPASGTLNVTVQGFSELTPPGPVARLVVR